MLDTEDFKFLVYGRLESENYEKPDNRYVKKTATAEVNQKVWTSLPDRIIVPDYECANGAVLIHDVFFKDGGYDCSRAFGIFTGHITWREYSNGLSTKPWSPNSSCPDVRSRTWK